MGWGHAEAVEVHAGGRGLSGGQDAVGGAVGEGHAHGVALRGPLDARARGGGGGEVAWHGLVRI